MELACGIVGLWETGMAILCESIRLWAWQCALCRRLVPKAVTEDEEGSWRRGMRKSIKDAMERLPCRRLTRLQLAKGPRQLTWTTPTSACGCASVCYTILHSSYMCMSHISYTCLEFCFVYVGLTHFYYHFVGTLRLTTYHPVLHSHILFLAYARKRKRNSTVSAIRMWPWSIRRIFRIYSP